MNLLKKQNYLMQHQLFCIFVYISAADQGRVMQEQMTGGPMPTDPGKAFEVGFYTL